MNNAHNRHVAVPRPAYGQFHRREWAILGAPCGTIQDLAADIARTLSSIWKIGYVDADHRETPSANHPLDDMGISARWTDKIGFQRFEQQGAVSSFLCRTAFLPMDAVLVNGNHFTADRQIVLVDPLKEDSLRRKLDRLTDVRLVLLRDGIKELPRFLREHLVSREQSPPVLSWPDRMEAATILRKELTADLPPVKGLVLAGGHSRRMGTDKGSLRYHDTPQQDRMMDQLQACCEATYLSCRPDQAGLWASEHAVIEDSFLGLGPLGAILSAFRQYPDHAWLVVACDLPLLEQRHLDHLLLHRRPSAVATAFVSPVNGLPEPLVAVWEPRSYPVLLQFLAQGHTCPRKALIQSDTQLVLPPNPEALLNANTPEEAARARHLLSERQNHVNRPTDTPS
ncbi:MAG: hypothetical protein RLY31_1305 [Bacteroidota bacterium]|jgi:molybdopterin-guanine dinucleotide biosynthesis protein A